jgi:hypothetical protein
MNSLQETEVELRALPRAPSGDPVGEVLHVLSSFTRDLSHRLEGTPEENGLLQTIRPHQQAFKRAIRQTAPNFVPWAETQRGRELPKAQFLANEEGDDENPAAESHGGYEAEAEAEAEAEGGYDGGCAEEYGYAEEYGCAEEYGDEHEEEEEEAEAEVGYPTVSRHESAMESLPTEKIYIDQVFKRAQRYVILVRHVFDILRQKQTSYQRTHSRASRQLSFHRTEGVHQAIHQAMETTRYGPL